MIEVDVPRGYELNANQRLHWSVKARRTSFLRLESWAQVVSSRNPTILAPFAHRVRCIVDVSWPNKRRRDVHNIMPTVKACIDGIVDSGLLVDDSDKYLVGPDLRVADTLAPKGSAFLLRFTFEDVA